MRNKQPTRFIDINDAALVENNHVMYYRGTVFTGTLYRMYNRHDTMHTECFENGQLNGLNKSWYANGQIAQARLYKNGKRAGTQYNWWEDGKLKSYYNYADDLLNGPAEERFKNGTRYRKMNYTMGYEEGMQQMWDYKGTLIANYEMRNGRKYGLTGVKNCVTPVTTSIKPLINKK